MLGPRSKFSRFAGRPLVAFRDVRWVPSFPLIAALVLLSACSSLRGRADDALAKGDYGRAAELYAEVLRKHPDDAEAKARLTRAHRGLLDEALDRFDVQRAAGRENEALSAGLAVLETKDRVLREAIDEPRRARLAGTVTWLTEAARALVRGETNHGRALAGRARQRAMAAVLRREELAPVRPELEEEIAAAGARTCEKATRTAGDQPFALELVAAYCKEVGGPMPARKARPLVVGGLVTRGTIAGTPPDEQDDLARAMSSALERSVWFSPTSAARASVDVDGLVSAAFSATPTELTRSWTESVPYEAIETYTEPVELPYLAVETYTERVPYVAYEERLEPCRPPRQGLCNRTHPVTRYRDESRTREVTKTRTEYVERTRTVTRYRQEPRVFRFAATKHQGRYRATHRITVELGSPLRPVVTRGQTGDERVAYEHDAEFAPAGVHPERGTLPSAASWREDQRARITRDLHRALDDAWVDAFCSDALGTIEDAARCVHARPARTPKTVRARIAELVSDDVDRVLALPRPKESPAP